MKTIIAGSRGIHNYSTLLAAIKSCPFKVTEVVSGGALGADRLGERWARNNGLSLQIFRANWNVYGKRAGFIRNAEMAKNAKALIALWDGYSNGTKNMIDLAKEAGIEVFVYMVPSALEIECEERAAERHQVKTTL